MIKRFLRTCFLKSVALPGIAVLVFLPGSSVYAHPGDTPGPGQQGSSSAFLRELSSRDTVTRADCMRAAAALIAGQGAPVDDARLKTTAPYAHLRERL